MKYEFSSRIFPIAAMASVASVLQILEIFYVLPLPFLKIGLANGIILFMLFKGLFLEAILVNLIRILAGGFFSGKIFSLPFVYSFSGGMTSTLIMLIIVYFFKKNLSVFPISIAGAITHNLTQLYLVTLTFNTGSIPTNMVNFTYIFSIITGLIVGYFTNSLLKLEIEISIKKN
ncbi:MAG: Gx transporter family protein [Candidatus Delongbacteria bacterium]|nr:Gx transporter family protein [Candidatus Delongbacteria bacterium]MBN2835243.1 Gx transporter family protein [Candidatus Delongbacteria bacterium]